MYNVRFPGLNLEFKINPVAFSLGDIEIRWYGILIMLGFLMSYIYVMIECKRFKISQSNITDSIIVGFFTGIIGARLYYVLFYPGNDYLKNPLSILNINQGGIAIYGGIIGGLLGGLIVAKKKKVPLLSSLDIVSLGFLIGQSIGRWGNFTNQEAFGSETDSLFRMVSENTNGLSVHPCFLYESLWCLVCFFVLHIFNTRFKKFDGQTFLLYIILYGVERFFVESLRTDSLITPVLNLRVSQVVAAISIVISIISMSLIRRGNKFEHN